MQIHHYTSIETLALILKHKTIRFNRLDQVDDMEESIYGSGTTETKLSQYIFVSCWTKNQKENISLWKMYTNYKGVRITLDENMFVTYPIWNQSKSFFPFPFSFDDDYVTISHVNEAKLQDVIYIDNPELKIRDLIFSEGGKTNIQMGNVGIFKNNEWAFQNESRFKITIYPINSKLKEEKNKYTPDEFFIELMRPLPENVILNYPISRTYMDIPIEISKLNEIIVMMGPKTTEAERIIVESLLHNFTNAIIEDSYFKGKIRK